MVKLNVVLPPITMDQEASDVDRKRKSISAPDQYVKLPDISRHTHTAPVPKYFEANTTLMRTKVMKMKVPITNKLVKFKPGFKSKGSYREQYRPPTLKLCRDCQHFWRFFRSQDLTFMAAVSGENLDLYDVRKTQRRLKVLINVNDVDSPQRYPIRRKPLPQGVCYVCSHLDLDGKYQHPHAYLFRKGFFNKCSHHTKTPYPTLIESGDGDHPEDVFNFNKQLSDEELKLSVSVRVKSRRDTHSDSPVPIFGQTHFDTSVLNGVQLESRIGESSKFQLPSIFAEDDKISGVDSLRNSRNSRKSDQRYSHHSDQRNSYQSDHRNSYQSDNRNSRQSGSDTWASNSRNSQNLKNSSSRTGSQRQRHNDNYKINPTISDRSWLEADGYVRDYDDEEEENEEVFDDNETDERPKSFAVHEEERPQSPPRPQSENVSPLSSRHSRPKAGKRSFDSGVGDEGHLKYHHRLDNESLPHDGFSISSRESSIQTPARSRISSKLSEQELALIGSQISRKGSEDGRVLSQSSSSFILHRLAASSMADHWCTCQNIDYSQVKCEECLKVGGHEKWCVHARSTSRQGNCPHCGKPIMKTNKRGSNMSFRSGSQSIDKQTKSDEKRVKFEDDERSREIVMDHGKFFKGILKNDPDDKSKEEEEDGVWTKTEEAVDPSIDSDIHKRAYLKALFELRMTRLNKINELDESWILDRISKPTFSYFKLRPGQEKANVGSEEAKSIGLTPDDSKGPTVKKSMKHIFGKKIKVDDYYPGGKKNPLIKVTMKKEKKRQTMPVHSIDKSI